MSGQDKKKLWAGRFAKPTDQLVEEFNSSLAVDQRLYRQDIEGSIAHATMLGEAGIIPAEEAELIAATLGTILQELEQGTIVLDPRAEDIHMNIELILTGRLGDVGRKLHTGRSRNDQVALDSRLYLKSEIREVQRLLGNLRRVLLTLAEAHLRTVMPGYTHLQKAQPVTLGHYLLAYESMLARDHDRLEDCFRRTDRMPLGSGALAGTTLPIDRQRVASLLNFADITSNSLDAVSDRDFAVEFIAAGSLLMIHLSRFAEELILWSTDEFGFVEMDDAFATGSSLMPQKKNPDVAELVRGKTGRVIGDLVALLTVLKGLPLAYNKDLQEDKEALFDALDTVKQCLAVFAPMVRSLKFHPPRMREAAGRGYTNATDLADYLVRQGVPFRTAHEASGRLVAYCLQRGCLLEELSLEEFASESELDPKYFSNTVYEAISLETCVANRRVPGGPSPEAVRAALAAAWSRLRLEQPEVQQPGAAPA